MTRIYFAKCGPNIKVGVATNVRARISTLEVGAAAPLNLIGSVVGDRHLERALHKRLKSHHVKGEWFRDCPDVRSIIGEAIDGHDLEPLAGKSAPSFSNFGKVCRAFWPHKTAENFAALVGCSVRSAAYQISGEQEPSLRAAQAVFNKMLER